PFILFFASGNRQAVDSLETTPCILFKVMGIKKAAKKCSPHRDFLDCRTAVDLNSFPRLCVETLVWTLCILLGLLGPEPGRDAERRDAPSHAERGNECGSHCKEIRVVAVAPLDHQAQRVKRAQPAQNESAPSPAKSENCYCRVR